jgi:hypothetical protein
MICNEAETNELEDFADRDGCLASQTVKVIRKRLFFADLITAGRFDFPVVAIIPCNPVLRYERLPHADAFGVTDRLGPRPLGRFDRPRARTFAPNRQARLRRARGWRFGV